MICFKNRLQDLFLDQYISSLSSRSPRPVLECQSEAGLCSFQSSVRPVIPNPPAAPCGQARGGSGDLGMHVTSTVTCTDSCFPSISRCSVVLNDLGDDPGRPPLGLTLFLMPALPLASWVTLGKSSNLSESWDISVGYSRNEASFTGV